MNDGNGSLGALSSNGTAFRLTARGVRRWLGSGAGKSEIYSLLRISAEHGCAGRKRMAWSAPQTGVGRPDWREAHAATIANAEPARRRDRQEGQARLCGLKSSHEWKFRECRPPNRAHRRILPRGRGALKTIVRFAALALLSGTFAARRVPLRVSFRLNAGKFREFGPRCEATEHAGNGRPAARVPESARRDGRSTSATVAATVHSEYLGRFVAVDVALSRERPHGRSR
jgi:hypothetical protein